MLAWLLMIPSLAFGQMTLVGAGKAPAGGGGGGGSPPAYSWITGGDLTTGLVGYTTSSSGNTINSGDTLVIIVMNNDNVNFPHNLQCPSGWTQGFVDFDNGGNSGINVELCWKVAGSSESGTYSGTWTTTNTQPGTWELIRFTGGNATTPVEAAAMQENGSGTNSTSTVAPSVTSSGSSRTLVSCSKVGNTGITFTTPSGMTAAFDTIGVNAYHLGCATLAVGSGATGTKTWTLNSGARSSGISFLLKP